MHGKIGVFWDLPSDSQKWETELKFKIFAGMSVYARCCVKIQNPSPTWARQLDYSEQPQLYSLILIIHNILYFTWFLLAGKIAAQCGHAAVGVSCEILISQGGGVFSCSVTTRLICCHPHLLSRLFISSDGSYTFTLIWKLLTVEIKLLLNRIVHHLTFVHLSISL